MRSATDNAKRKASKGEYADLGEKTVYWMREKGLPYPSCGYGGHFYEWMYSAGPQPYHSYGNGAAMRVSPCGFIARSMNEAKALSKVVTGVTHNHPEGIKGAEATTVAIYHAKIGSSMIGIREVIQSAYYLLASLLTASGRRTVSMKSVKKPCHKQSNRFWSLPALRTQSERNLHRRRQ